LLLEEEQSAILQKGIEDRRAMKDSLEAEEIERGQRMLDSKMEMAQIESDFKEANDAKELARIEKEKISQEMLGDSYLDMTNSLIDASQEGLRISKASANAQKLIAIGQIQMNAAVGMMKVWADPGYPAAIPLTIAIGAQSSAATAVVASQKFADGGIVAGNSTSGDNVPAMVNSKEIIMNQNQQADLWNFIKGGSNGGGGSNNTFNFSGNIGLDESGIVDVVTSAIQRQEQTGQPVGIGF